MEPNPRVKIMVRVSSPGPGVGIKRGMTETRDFIEAYHEFKNTVDLTKGGFLPELNNLVWLMLMGVPRVPADEDSSEDSAVEAIDQRVMILKAVFVEVNRDRDDLFLDQGLERYDKAGKTAKVLLKGSDGSSDSKEG